MAQRRRHPAVAGMFYPASPSELRAQIEGFLDQAAAELPTDAPAPKAMIAPHAGTIYSGPVAASAYVRLRAARERIERVVLLGPAHRVALRGLAATSADVWETPLGDIPVDRAALDELLELPQVRLNDEAHRQEHSLEVHLPFLQCVLDRFRLVPLVVGMSHPAEVAEVIGRLWGGPETLVVISSDLSHFHDYATAQMLDRETSRRIEALDFEHIDGDGACGVMPLRGLLMLARERGLSVDTIDLRNSGDTAGPRREVVGYGCYVVA